MDGLDFGTSPQNCRHGGGIVNTCERTVQLAPHPDSPDQTEVENSRSARCTLLCLKVVRKICFPMSFFLVGCILKWIKKTKKKNIQARRNSRCQPQRKPKASSGQVHPDAPFICPFHQSVCESLPLPPPRKNTHFRKPLQRMEPASNTRSCLEVTKLFLRSAFNPINSLHGIAKSCHRRSIATCFRRVMTR